MNNDESIKLINEPLKTFKTKDYAKNREYCKERYRKMKYIIRQQYFDKKMKKIQDKADLFREKLKQESLNEKLN